jgi:hypothetical protein
MARYRAIHQQIWRDEDFLDYPVEQKLLFIYLCTNSATTESGIYKINFKIVSVETGIVLSRFPDVLTNLKNVSYDPTTKSVFIRRFRIYNAGGNPEKIRKSIENDVKTNPSRILWNEFIRQYPEFKDTVTGTMRSLNLTSPPPHTPP